jgi:hypothetical protein
MMNLKVFFGAKKNAVVFIGVGVVIVLSLLFVIAKDNEKSKQPSISANQIVQHFDVYGYYRKFIGMSDDGFYIIQDFYSENETPRSNQYRVKSCRIPDDSIRADGGRFEGEKRTRCL